MSIVKIFTALLAKLPATLLFVTLAWILGLFLGVLVTAGRLSHFRILRSVLNVYVSFIRSIPMVLQLFLIYYGLPMLLSLFKINTNGVNKLVFCGIAFSLYYGAYLSEVLRPAYQSVDRSQREAAIAAGYNRWQVKTKIMIPQAIPIALPSLGNEVLNMLHQSSLLFTLGVVDIMGQAQQTIDQNYTVNPVLVYFLAGGVYLIITLLIEMLRRGLEKRTGRFLRVGGETNE